MNISGIRPAVGFYDYNSIKQAEEVSVVSQEMTPNRTSEVQADTATVAQNTDADRPLVLMIMQVSTNRMLLMSLREQIVIFVH